MSARQACGRVDLWTPRSCVTAVRSGMNPGIVRMSALIGALEWQIQGVERPQRSTRVHITRIRPYGKETFTKHAYYHCFCQGGMCGRHVDACGRPQPKNASLNPFPRYLGPGSTRNSPRGRVTRHSTHVHTSTVHTAPRRAS